MPVLHLHSGCSPAASAQVGMWDAHENHYKKLLPLKQMFSVLARSVGGINRFHRNKPSFTVYSWAALRQMNATGAVKGKTKATSWDAFKAQWSSHAKAMVTFVTQMVLIVLLVMGMDLSEFGSQVRLGIGSAAAAAHLKMGFLLE